MIALARDPRLNIGRDTNAGASQSGATASVLETQLRLIGGTRFDVVGRHARIHGIPRGLGSIPGDEHPVEPGSISRVVHMNEHLGEQHLGSRGFARRWFR